MTSPHLGDAPPATLAKPREQLFTFFLVDPLAVPVARWLSRFPVVTPNRITVLAGITALGSAGSFVAGLYPLAGALFILRFFLDCLDGKVARARGTSSAQGGALDLVTDVAGILTCFAAAGWSMLQLDAVPVELVLALLVLVGVYNWALQYRKQLAGRAGTGDGGMRDSITTGVPVLRAWVRWSDRRGINPVPYAVELEILALGLLPIVGIPSAIAVGLWLAAAFYLMASLVNVRRVWRIAGELDATRNPAPTDTEETR